MDVERKTALMHIHTSKRIAVCSIKNRSLRQIPLFLVINYNRGSSWWWQGHACFTTYTTTIKKRGKMKTIVVGSGKLAQAILEAGYAGCINNIERWGAGLRGSSEKSVVVHAGSGRELGDCIKYCSRTKSTLVELSTGMETERLSPDFPLVLCPNTSILVLKTLCMLRASGLGKGGYEVSIIESHQAAKKTEPGTAFAFANALGVQTSEIVSIREPRVQEDVVGIPAEYADKHAYHKIVIADGTDRVTLETRVLGHESYARGVVKILESVKNNQLENRQYTIVELIEKGLL